MSMQGRFAFVLVLVSFIPLAAHAVDENAEVQRLKKQLASPVPSQKVQAAGKLAQLGSAAASATDQLIICLDDSDPDVRLYAANALAHVSQELPNTLRNLTRTLADSDEHVSYAAEWAIAYLANSIQLDSDFDEAELDAVDSAFAAAFQKLQEKAYQQRHLRAVQQAAELLRVSKVNREKDLRKSDSETASKEAAAIDAIRLAEITAMQQRFAEAKRLDRFRITEEMGAASANRPDLLRAVVSEVLKSEDRMLMHYTVKRLGSSAQLALGQLIEETSNESLPDWTPLLLQELVPVNEKVVGRLLSLMRAPTTSVDIKSAAALSLGKSKVQIEIVRLALVDVLTDDSNDEQVRVSAVNALAALGEIPISLQNRVLTVFKQSNLPLWLRSEIAQSLHRVAPNSADMAMAITDCMKSTDVNDAEYADLAIALGKFGNRGAVGLPQLIAGASSTDDYICDSCVKALRGLGESASPATAALISLVDNPQIPISTKSEAAEVLRAIGPAAVARLIEHIPQSLTTGREHFFHVLTIIGPDAKLAIPTCLARVEDATESLRVRTAAVTALGAIGPASDAAVPTIRLLLADKESVELRCAALLALAQIKPDAAASSIVEYEKDANILVRTTAAYSKHLCGNTASSVRSLLALLGEQENDALVENALLDIGPVALPLLLNTARDREAPEQHRITCMQVAARMEPVDWPPLVQLLQDEKLNAQFADAILGGWNFDDKLLPHVIEAMQSEENSAAIQHMSRMAEYLISDLGEGGDGEQWARHGAIANHIDSMASVRNVNEPEVPIAVAPAMVAKATAPPEVDPLIPEPTVGTQMQLLSGDSRQVKVFYGTNRKPLEIAQASGTVSSRSTIAASLGLAIAACATCAFGFVRRKSPAYAVAALAGLGSLSTLAVSGLNLANTGEPKAEQIKYTGEFSSNVELGVCEVSIPPTHRPGELESPSLLLQMQISPDPNKHIVLTSVKRLDSDAFYEDLHSELDNRGSNILVFVHGYNVSFEDAARRTAQMSYDLKFPGAPVFYSWPSQANWYRYRTDQENIENSIDQIKDFLLELSDRSHATTINLVAHSMGNVGLTAALSRMAGPSKFNQIVLAAPDIDASTFRQEIAPRIVTQGRRVTLYTSKTDLALIASKYFNHGSRAGDSGSEMLLIPGIETIDATAVDSSLLGHSYYGSNVNVLFDLGELLSGKPIEARPYLRTAANAGSPYWYFDPKSIARQTPISTGPLRR